MISHEMLVYFCMALYGFYGIANIILGAAQANKNYETHYGLGHAIVGLFVLAIAIWMYIG